MSTQVSTVRYDFSGHVVLVTGAARGQGRSHALAFAAAGASVVIADICEQVDSIEYPMATPEDLAATQALVEDLDVRCLSRQTDVRDADAVQALVDEAIAEFGQIDVLINNAGIDVIVDFAELTERGWNDMIETHLRGAFLVSQAVSKTMIPRRRGKILTTGSTNSFVGLPGHVHYVTAKHGLLGFTRALALDLAPHGINVNMVAPGAVLSPMNRMMEGHDDWAEALIPLTGTWNVLESDPERQMLDPQEITNAMLWLASDASNYVTGASIVVDAGATIK
jgi:NAD(P)-dependent dehydrogenase (short-subunit alcohol dehydrogenase family)